MSERLLASRIDIRGIVQGVGFRPFVFRTAHDCSIHGWVRNDSRGVSIHAEGTSSQLDSFVAMLGERPPAAAHVASIERSTAAVEGYVDFQILSSDAADETTVRISPDLPTCPECLRELHDPSNARFQYPYINCTECGPRYSIIQALPYDRSNTTMTSWTLCDACQKEYEDPVDRRYHAQPTACHACGPQYRLISAAEVVLRGREAILRAAELLSEGTILAVKGIGGYHLACDARDTAAVSRLRERKFRKEKPFAVMVRDLDEARAIAWLDDIHISLLADRPRPIVLAPSRESFPRVAPQTDELGIMLPYAPLHELLFHLGAPSPLVLTSGNRSSEPIAFLDDDAFERLHGIADAFLVGERPIARRVDDSVVAVRDGQSTMLRRSRGYAPGVVSHLPSHRPILAVGADLKNTIALVVDGDVILSQHIGDLGDLETNRAFEQTIGDLLTMYNIPLRDMVVAHDLHPEYISTRYAKSLNCRRTVPVQHHRAHVASVLAELGDLEQPVLGIALDGTGYGDDGTIWGFEVFAGSVAEGFARVSHLRPFPLPGGDAAARFPVQAAAGLLADVDIPDLRRPPFLFPDRFHQSQQLVDKNVRCFQCTSAGRLFDAVAALCGFTRDISYEGQAAAWLENLAHSVPPCAAYAFPEFDHRPLLRAVVADRMAGRSVGEIAYAFHAAVGHELMQVAEPLMQQHDTQQVVFSGGVFQNRLLRSLLLTTSASCVFSFNRCVPPNDGGISLGQAAIASYGVGSG